MLTLDGLSPGAGHSIDVKAKDWSRFLTEAFDVRLSIALKSPAVLIIKVGLGEVVCTGHE